MSHISLAPGIYRPPTATPTSLTGLLTFSIRGIELGFQLPLDSIVTCAQSYKRPYSTDVLHAEIPVTDGKPYVIPGYYASLVFTSQSKLLGAAVRKLGTVEIWHDTAGVVGGVSSGHLFIAQNPDASLSVEILFSMNPVPAPWSTCLGSTCRQPSPSQPTKLAAITLINNLTGKSLQTWGASGNGISVGPGARANVIPSKLFGICDSVPCGEPSLWGLAPALNFAGVTPLTVSGPTGHSISRQYILVHISENAWMISDVSVGPSLFTPNSTFYASYFITSNLAAALTISPPDGIENPGLQFNFGVALRSDSDPSLFPDYWVFENVGLSLFRICAVYKTTSPASRGGASYYLPAPTSTPATLPWLIPTTTKADAAIFTISTSEKGSMIVSTTLNGTTYYLGDFEGYLQYVPPDQKNYFLFVGGCLTTDGPSSSALNCSWCPGSCARHTNVSFRLHNSQFFAQYPNRILVDK